MAPVWGGPIDIFGAWKRARRGRRRFAREVASTRVRGVGGGAFQVIFTETVALDCLKMGNINPQKRFGDGLALVPFCNIPGFARPFHRYNSRSACESPRARGGAAAIDLPWRRRRVMQHTPKNSNVTHCKVVVFYCTVEVHTGTVCVCVW